MQSGYWLSSRLQWSSTLRRVKDPLGSMSSLDIGGCKKRHFFKFQLRMTIVISPCLEIRDFEGKVSDQIIQHRHIAVQFRTVDPRSSVSLLCTPLINTWSLDDSVWILRAERNRSRKFRKPNHSFFILYTRKSNRQRLSSLINIIIISIAIIAIGVRCKVITRTA